jgi:hypothetical protein
MRRITASVVALALAFAVLAAPISSAAPAVEKVGIEEGWWSWIVQELERLVGFGGPDWDPYGLTPPNESPEAEGVQYGDPTELPDDRSTKVGGPGRDLTAR